MFHGWVVVGAVHLALFVIFGVAYSFAAFFGAFEAEFHASRGDIALVFSLSGFLYFMVGAIAGPIADRFGPRRVALVGMAILAASLALASRAPNVTTLYLTYGIGVGLGVGCVYVPAVGAIQRWFVRRRGLASGIASAGVGLGTLVVPILAGWLLPMLGWRSTFIVFAVGALVLGGCAVSLIESDPARRGLAPDGTPPPPGGPTLSAPTGITLRAALGTRQFWYFFAAILGCAMGLFIPFAHLAPYARDHGHSEQIAAALIGAIGLGSLIGRFALAGLSDRISRPLFLAALFAGMALMLALWLASTGVVPLAIFAVVFGALYGGFVALAPALTMDYFGGRSVAGIIGALYSAAGIGNLIGPWLAGVAFDIRGSYDLPIIVSIACMLIASGFALFLRRQPSLTN